MTGSFDSGDILEGDQGIAELATEEQKEALRNIKQQEAEAEAKFRVEVTEEKERVEKEVAMDHQKALHDIEEKHSREAEKLRRERMQALQEAKTSSDKAQVKELLSRLDKQQAELDEKLALERERQGRNLEEMKRKKLLRAKKRAEKKKLVSCAGGR